MTENREKAIKRTKNLAYWFMGEMLKEEERGEKEKEAFEKSKRSRGTGGDDKHSREQCKSYEKLHERSKRSSRIFER